MNRPAVLYLSAPGTLPATPAEAPAHWRATLSGAERDRLDGFGHPGAAAEFLTGRAMVRELLSRHHPATPPQDWRFVFNDHGAPSVDPAMGAAAAWKFNLSHTRGLVAVALARDPIGVDVETHARSTQTDKVAHRYFAAVELAAMRAIADDAARKRRFFDWWTLKEAYIKARGKGLAIPLREFAWSLEGSELGLEFAAEHDGGRPDRWAAALLDVAPSHRAAVCFDADGPADLAVAGWPCAARVDWTPIGTRGLRLADAAMPDV